MSSPTVITYCPHLLFSPPVLTIHTACCHSSHLLSHFLPYFTFSHFSLSACSHSLTLCHFLSPPDNQILTFRLAQSVSTLPLPYPHFQLTFTLPPSHSAPLHSRETPVAAEGCCSVCSSSCCARRKIARSFGLGKPLGTSLKMPL